MSGIMIALFVRGVLLDSICLYALLSAARRTTRDWEAYQVAGPGATDAHALATDSINDYL